MLLAQEATGAVPTHAQERCFVWDANSKTNGAGKTQGEETAAVGVPRAG